MAHVAQIRYHKNEARLDVTVPRGTVPSAVARLNETRLSGLDLNFREELADVLQIDIETGRQLAAGH